MITIHPYTLNLNLFCLIYESFFHSFNFIDYLILTKANHFQLIFYLPIDTVRQFKFGYLPNLWNNSLTPLIPIYSFLFVMNLKWLILCCYHRKCIYSLTISLKFLCLLRFWLPSSETIPLLFLMRTLQKYLLIIIRFIGWRYSKMLLREARIWFSHYWSCFGQRWGWFYHSISPILKQIKKN